MLPSSHREPLQSVTTSANLINMPPMSGRPLAPTPTPQLLAELIAKAPDGPVDLEWLLTHLDRRSFGLLLLLLGMLVVIPGVATIATLALLFPAVQMMLGRSAPSFPGFCPNDSLTSIALSDSQSLLARCSMQSRGLAVRGGTHAAT